LTAPDRPEQGLRPRAAARAGSRPLRGEISGRRSRCSCDRNELF